MVVLLGGSAALVGYLDRAVSAAGGPRPHERAAIEEIVATSVVEISSIGCLGQSTGTGFIVDGGVVTNRHLVLGASAIAVAIPGPRSATLLVEVSRVGEEIDAATAGPLPIAAEGLVLASADAVVGESVVMVGWVDGRLRTLDGTVHLYTRGGAYGAQGEVVLLDPGTTFGFSGGPVLNRNGEVLAMLSAVDRTTDLAIAIPVSSLAEWLNSATDQPASPRC